MNSFSYNCFEVHLIPINFSWSVVCPDHFEFSNTVLEKLSVGISSKLGFPGRCFNLFTIKSDDIKFLFPLFPKHFSFFLSNYNNCNLSFSFNLCNHKLMNLFLLFPMLFLLCFFCYLNLFLVINKSLLFDFSLSVLMLLFSIIASSSKFLCFPVALSKCFVSMSIFIPVILTVQLFSSINLY